MKKILLFILMLFLLINLFAGICLADTNIFLFNEKTYYDIYLYGESKTVIRHVKILRQAEINRKIFLVIEPSDFNLSDSQGYVNLDAVSAILPSMKFRVEGTEGFRLFHHSEDK